MGGPFGAQGPFGNQQQGATLSTFGQGKPANTPLSPVVTGADFADTTISPEQRAAYLNQQATDNGLEWQRELVKNMAPGVLGGLAGAGVGTLVGGPLGAIPGFVAGMGTNALVSGGTHYLMHRDPLQAALEGGVNALLHGVGGARAAAVGNDIRQGPLKAAFRSQMGDEATYRKGLVDYEKALPAYERALAEHKAAMATGAAEHGATQAKNVADVVKSRVTPWADVESSAAGISRMIGPDWKRVRDAYDGFLKEAIPTARGQQIKIPEEAAARLGITPRGRVELSKSGLNPGEDLIIVDAGEALERTVGKSMKSAKAYHQVAAALDEAGIGDPAIRQMYREALSFKTFAEKNRIVENGVFYPDRVQKGLAGIQSRRAADIRQTELDPVLRQATPFEPTPAPQAPLKPREPVYENPVTKIGSGGGSLVGEAAGRAAGHASGMGWGVGHTLGKIGSKLIPGMPEYQAPPFSTLGGASGYGLPLTLPQRALVNAEGAGIGVGVRALGTPQGLDAVRESKDAIKDGWDYILGSIAPTREEAKPATPPSPLRPGTITSDEEER